MSGGRSPYDYYHHFISVCSACVFSSLFSWLVVSKVGKSYLYFQRTMFCVFIEFLFHFVFYSTSFFFIRVVPFFYVFYVFFYVLFLPFKLLLQPLLTDRNSLAKGKWNFRVMVPALQNGEQKNGFGSERNPIRANEYDPNDVFLEFHFSFPGEENTESTPPPTTTPFILFPSSVPTSLLSSRFFLYSSSRHRGNNSDIEKAWKGYAIQVFPCILGILVTLDLGEI